MKLPGFELTAEQEKRLNFLARREGVAPDVWLKKKAAEIAKQILGETDLLDSKEVGRQMNVSHYTVMRYYRQGLFPHAVAVNSRVIRIPQTDVQRLMSSRQITRPE